MYGISDAKYCALLDLYEGDEETVKNLIEDWGAETVEDGYSVFAIHTAFGNVEEVQKLDDCGFFESDEEAAMLAAKKYGYTYIPTEELPQDDWLCYHRTILDTPANREVLYNYENANS